MRLYSYVVKHDNGFAPNPFWGYCTVACCKPNIRKRAKEGDWVVGTGSAQKNARTKLVYAMEVTERRTFKEYSKDERFKDKMPRRGVREERGDNIYYQDQNGRMRQRAPSYHSIKNSEDEKKKRHDLSGKYVLISGSGHFYYFGRAAPDIPKELQAIIKKGPNYKCNFPEDIISGFLHWVKTKEPGIHELPFDYKDKKLFTD